MKRLFLLFVLASQLALSAWAEEQSITLSVPGMNCPVCPITISKALGRVDGVKSAKVDYDSKSATIIFDDQVTATETLMKATANAGYPSSVRP